MRLRPVDIDDRPEGFRPPITPAHLDAGMSAVFRIAGTWGLSNGEIRALLGSPSRATFYNWKAGDVRTVPRDTVSRISLILGIHKALSILYKDAELAAGWMSRPNAAFGGQCAKDRACAGELADLVYLRDYLDAVRGGWS